jgi:hypothetical protein
MLDLGLPAIAVFPAPRGAAYDQLWKASKEIVELTALAPIDLETQRQRRMVSTSSRAWTLKTVIKSNGGGYAKPLGTPSG